MALGEHRATTPQVEPFVAFGEHYAIAPLQRRRSFIGSELRDKIIVSTSIGYLYTRTLYLCTYLVIAIELEVIYLAITLLLVLLSISSWCT